MLLAYVSNELDQAIHDAAVEVRDTDGGYLTHVRSAPSGAVHADLPAGDYELVLARDGYGPKRSRVTAGGAPARIRLLSEQVYGYMWPKWSVSGERGEMRVSSPEAYKAELWRYGLEKEFVELIGWFDEHGPQAMRQVLPDTDISRDGAQFNSVGFTSPGHIRRVLAPERSGLYYVHITTASGKFTAFPWIVAPAKPTAKIVALAGTNNWNAYNRFGGRSNYINEARLPDTPTVSSRQDLPRYTIGNTATQTAKLDEYQWLSFDRPDLECDVREDEQVTDSLPGRLRGTLAPGFWRLTGWLEREGFEYDVYAEGQLHDGTLDLDAYDVVLLECHPEYWSRQMYQRLKDWVEQRGGNLMYLGGNGIDCEIEFNEDGTAARYLNARGSGLDNRFATTYESPAKLLGVVFTSAGEGTGAPYAVVDQDSWIYEGTGLRAGDLFGVTSMSERIPGGASGHETDKRTSNTPSDFVVLAKGTNVDDGGAEIVYRDVPGPGGQVFSVGSMTYIPALLWDDALSTVTANVLRRFTS